MANNITHLKTMSKPKIKVPQNKPSYAQQQNSRFSASKSHYVTLSQRVNAEINELTKSGKVNRHSLEQSLEEFRRRNPNIQSWADLHLTQAASITLDKVFIDTTFQRKLDFDHALNILVNFDEFKVMPVSVYQDPAAGPDVYVCWDGQHTSVVLYLIATSLGLDPKNCVIPVNINRSTQKSKMREGFIVLNGEGKRQLDLYDFFEQQVYAVRTDGNNNPDWKVTEQKQQYLESAGLFVAHKKHNDTDEPGALSSLKELCDEKLDLSLTKQFCEYAAEMKIGSKRAVPTKESDIIYEFFRLCHTQKIKVDAKYIQELVSSLMGVGGVRNDFDADKMVKHANKAHKEYWKSQFPDMKYEKRDYAIRVGFFLAQLAKKFKGKLPKTDQQWPVPAKDLF